MTPVNLQTCSRIQALYASLSTITGPREKVFLKSANVIREIGSLLESMMGHYKHRWTREHFQNFEPGLPFDFDKAIACLNLSIQIPEKATMENAAQWSVEILFICGMVAPKPKARKAQRKASPSAIIFNTLKAAQTTVTQRMEGFEEFDGMTQATVNQYLHEHGDWINALLKELPSRFTQPPEPERIYDGTLGRFISGEIGA